MDEYYAFALLTATSFFTLINPFGSMPVFMSMTTDLHEKKRKRTARKAVIIAFFTLLVFAFSGQFIFTLFGISVNSLRIVGGVIFFIMGHDMLQARIGRIKVSGEESEVNAYVDDISITPLAIPMICGPGAITNAIVLMEDASSSLVMKITFVVILALIMLGTYLIFIGASKIMHILGDTGNKVMMRLMGLIVMVIAVEFFFSGLRPIVEEMMQQS